MFSNIQLFIVLVLSSRANSYGNYGTYCSPEDTHPLDHCYSRELVHCIDNVCRCNSTMAFISNYDAFGGRCVLKVGQLCSLSESDIHCYQHAICQDVGREDGLGVCGCIDPDVISENGEYCVHTALKFGDTCDNTTMICNAELDLVCDNGVHCRCDKGFDEGLSGDCFATYGFQCRNDSIDTRQTCDSYLQCNSQGKCECDRPESRMWFRRSNSYPQRGSCLTKHGEPCLHPSETCIDNAKCVTFNENELRCECGEYFKPSEDGTYCIPQPETILQHGEICVKDNTRNICSPDDFLECACANSNGTDCKCGCKYFYYIASNDGRCHAGHGAPCQSSGGNTTTTCYSEALLTCGEDGTCRCEDEERQIFDGVDKKCGLKFLQECERHDGNGNALDCQSPYACRPADERTNRCICKPGEKPYFDWLCLPYFSSEKLRHGDNCTAWEMLKYCDLNNNQDCVDHTCQCTQGFTYNSHQTNCFGSFGSECEQPFSPSDEKCDFGRNLACSNQTSGTFKCGCKLPGQIYLEEYLSCVLPSGENCLEAEIPDLYYPGTPCVPNAACRSGICTCNADFISQANGTCIAENSSMFLRGNTFLVFLFSLLMCIYL